MGPEIDLEELLDTLYEEIIPVPEMVASLDPEFIRCFRKVEQVIAKLKAKWEQRMDEMMSEMEKSEEFKSETH